MARRIEQGEELAPLDIRTFTEAELREAVADFHDCERLFAKTNIYGQLNYASVGFHTARRLVLALEYVLDTAGYPPRPTPDPLDAEKADAANHARLKAELGD